MDVVGKHIIRQLDFNGLVIAFNIQKLDFDSSQKGDNHIVSLPRLIVGEVSKDLKFIFGRFNVDICSLLIFSDRLQNLISDEILYLVVFVVTLHVNWAVAIRHYIDAFICLTYNRDNRPLLNYVLQSHIVDNRKRKFYA